MISLAVYSLSSSSSGFSPSSLDSVIMFNARNRARWPTTKSFAMNVISFASSLLDTCPTINIVIKKKGCFHAYNILLYK
jgi:hypothetical protein